MSGSRLRLVSGGPSLPRIYRQPRSPADPVRWTKSWSLCITGQSGWGGWGVPGKGKYPEKAWFDPSVNKTTAHRLRETWRLPHRPSPSADVMVGGFQHGDRRAEAVGPRKMRGDRASWLLVGGGCRGSKGVPASEKHQHSCVGTDVALSHLPAWPPEPTG